MKPLLTILPSPTDTMLYAVSAETANGCLLKDSIRVNVLHPAKIDLGRDTTFCQGDSLQLSALGLFSSYQWSTGSSSADITAKGSGTYWVKGVNNNGCASADTITILPLYPIPTVSISPKDVACLGQNDTLRAGSFLQYEWSNGSTEAFLPVSDTGKFWVRVGDANGCVGSDTADIKKIALPPEGFLPADTIVCAGTTVELQAAQVFSRTCGTTVLHRLSFRPAMRVFIPCR